MHSSSAVPPAPRGRPPDVCSLTGSPCSITTLARTPCVQRVWQWRRPSASPLPHSLRFLGSTISYSSRLLHMAGSGTFRAIPPYLFGQPAQPGTHCALSGMEREQRRRRKREWWKDEIADLPDWHAAAADLPAPKRVTHAASERCLASPALRRIPSIMRFRLVGFSSTQIVVSNGTLRGAQRVPRASSKHPGSRQSVLIRARHVL